MDTTALASLRRKWAAFAVLSLILLAGGFFFLRGFWQPNYAEHWLMTAVLPTFYLIIVLWRNLKTNYRQVEGILLPTLGWGNQLSLLRGLLVASLIGFFFLPRPPGWLAWIPGILYVLANITDFLDGYLARITNHVTRLGEILDMSFDGLGVLAAAWLAVNYGTLPAWYLSVALARYVFLGGLWLRKHQRKPVYDLPPSIRRRMFAGLQMGFLAVMLWPVFSPPATHIAALFFGLPMLVGFLLDWLFACGASLRVPRLSPARRNLFLRWLPPFLRLCVVGLNLGQLIDRYPNLFGYEASIVLITVLETVIMLLLLLGVTSRSMAVLGLILLGIHQMFNPLTASQIVLAGVYAGILFLGSGAFSLWAPEDYLVYRRPGESRELRNHTIVEQQR